MGLAICVTLGCEGALGMRGTIPETLLCPLHLGESRALLSKARVASRGSVRVKRARWFSGETRRFSIHRLIAFARA